MKTISIPVNNRPRLLERVFDSINRASGSGQWWVVVNCEPLSVIPHNLNLHLYTGRNWVHAGCWSNTFIASLFSMALEAEFNLYLEDDYLLSRDALLLVESWASRPDSSETVLCLRRPHDAQDLGHPEMVSRFRSGLFGCGFAWRKELWPVIRECWWKKGPMWDIAMEQLPVPQWRPLVNRSCGIGSNGTHSHGSTDPNLFGPAFDGCVDKFVFME